MPRPASGLLRPPAGANAARASIRHPQDARSDSVRRVSDRLSLEAVAAVLRLPATPLDQDWGIEHSDPRRVNDYVAFFVTRQHRLDAFVRGELVDLVLESANEALEDDIAFDEAAFRHFIEVAASDASERIDYWRSLDSTDADPWPVKAWLPTSD